MSDQRRVPAGVAITAALCVLLGDAATVRAQTGTVTGTVTHAVTGVAVPSGSVVLCDARRNCFEVILSSTGAFAQTVPAGTYFAYTDVKVLTDEIFDDVPCPFDCDISSAIDLGAPIVVPSGGKLVRNFALSPHGTVTGRVRDAATLAGIAGYNVVIAAAFNGGLRERSVATDAAGVFTVPAGRGRFHAYTNGSAAATHTNEFFGDILCMMRCSSQSIDLSRAPIAVSAGAVTTGIDFVLDRGATISGTVRLAPVTVIGPPPPPRLNVELYARVGPSLRRVDVVMPDQSGAYRFAALAAGTYYVATTTATFVDEVHDNRPCLSRCQSGEIAAGNPVTVGVGGAVSNLDFDLSGGGSLSGTITQAGTGTPIAATVNVFRRDGDTMRFDSTATATAGGAFSVPGLTTGVYAVLAQAAGHIDEFFGGLQCASCGQAAAASAAPVAVTSGLNTQGVNVVMDRGATISGTVRRSPSNAPFDQAAVGLYTGGPSPIQVENLRTQATGAYAFDGLPPGSYFVATLESDVANEVYNGVACPGGLCSTAFVVANGVALTPVPAGSVGAVDFALGPPSGLPGRPEVIAAANVPGGVQFTWSASRLGGPPTSYIFEAGLSSGTTFATLPVAGTALFVPGVPPGTYFVRVRGVNAAGTGDASFDLTLRVGAGGVVAPNAPTSFDAFVSSGRLTATWRPAQSGPVPTSYVLEVGSGAGLSNIAVVPLSAAVFRFDGVPPGFYFIRVRGMVGGVAGPPTNDIVLVADNAPAPPTQPVALTSRTSGGTVTLTWSAPTFGPVTSYVLEAGTATGLANIVVFDTGSPATSLVVPGVPSGTYFLRLRAVNAQGVSAPGGDHILVVP